MSPTPDPLPALDPGRPLRLTPTDVSQFVRLEQCERFLRFRLAERAGQDFMEPYGVVPQRISPLLSLSGHTFEETHRGGARPAVPHRPLRRQVCPGPQPAREQPGSRRRGPHPAARRGGPAVPAPPGGRAGGLAAPGRRGPAEAGAGRRRHPARPDRRPEIDRRGQGRAPPPGRLLPPHARTDLPGRAASHHEPIAMGVLFRPPADPTPEEQAEIEPRRDAARGVIRALDDALLEVVADPDAYLQSARDLVLGAGLDRPPGGARPRSRTCPTACRSSATAASTTSSA